MLPERVNMIARTLAVFNDLGEKVAHGTRNIMRVLRRKKKNPSTRLKIVIVREETASTLQRKRSAGELRRHAKRSSLGNGCGFDNDTSEAQVGDDGLGEEVEPYNSAGNAEEGIDQYHAIGYPPDEEWIQVQQQAMAAVAARLRVPRRRKELNIDAGTQPATDELDSAVSPTNSRLPSRTPSKMQWPLQSTVDGYGADRTNSQQGLGPSLAQGRPATVISYMEPQERFDSYVDAININNADAKTCCVHGVLLTDFAQLVAELEVIHNRIAMAKIRAAYAKRSSPSSTQPRPASWHSGSMPVAYSCSCGRPVESMVDQGAIKRQTWHAGESRAPRSRSRESETKEDVMLRHSAGTKLFRMSFPEGQYNRHVDQGLKDGEDTYVASTKRSIDVPPRVELNKGFDFRSECERIARRIRPTFAVSRF